MRRARRAGAAAVVAAAVVAAGAAPASAAPGDVDTSFGQNGTAAVPFPAGGTPTAMVAQPDGKIVVAGDADVSSGSSGTSSTEVAVARLLPNGSVDSAFGTSGATTTKVADNAATAAAALAPDGGILVLAEGLTGSLSSSTPPTIGAVLLRYTPSGQLDQTFGSGGTVTLGGSQQSLAGGLAVQPDGAILVGLVLGSPTSTTPPTGSLQRFSATGQPDATFGAGGSVTLQHPPTNVVLDPTGKILVTEIVPSTSPNQLQGALQRLGGTGVPDATFGQAGTAALPTSPVPLLPEHVLPSSSGRLYVSERGFGDEFDVLGLTSAGAVDPAFGNAGRISVSAPLQGLTLGSQVLSTGNLLVLHGTGTGSILTWGFNTDGTPAVGFGRQGQAAAPIPASGVAVQPGGDALAPDGGILAAAGTLDVSASGVSAGAVVTRFLGGTVGSAAQTNSAARTAGADRLATAIAASQALFATAPQGGANGPTNVSGQPYAQAVVLASADAFPDALVSVPLAVANGGPLLLTHQASLDQRVQTEIQRVLGDGSSGATIYVVGGPAAVSDQIVGQLTTAGYSVKRLFGADRFATAVQVASALGDPPVLVEATGTDFADATSAGAAAAHLGGAVLLTNGSTMPSETQGYLGAHSGDVRIAVGGPASQADHSAQPIVGSDRYATSAALAAAVFATPGTTGLATGTAYPDALVGGVVSALLGGPLILTDPATLSSPAASYLKSVAPWAATVQVFGGTGAVSDQVQGAALQAIT